MFIKYIHQQSLAVVWAIWWLLNYLKGCHLTVRTNHDALKWILNSTELTCKQWQLATAFVRIQIWCCPTCCNWMPENWRIFATEENWIRPDPDWRRYLNTMHHTIPASKNTGGVLTICTIMTWMTTEKVSDYLQYTQMHLAWNWNTMNDRKLRVTS